MIYNNGYQHILGLGLDKYEKRKEYLVPLRTKNQWVIIIIVCTLVIMCQRVALASDNVSTNVFDYVSSPNVNIIDEEVLFKCVFSPLSNPDNVTIHFLDSKLNNYEFKMIENNRGQFVNATSFSFIGRYHFYVTAEVDEQLVYSISRSFWITSSLSDKDNDRMDDDWEQFYGFDTTDPKDAFYDVDNDGFKNLDEFTLGTDPLEADYLEFIFLHISVQFYYIVLTVLFIFIALLCSLLGLRRSTRWI